jgi:hypothetical protein
MSTTLSLPRYRGEDLQELLRLLEVEKSRYVDFVVGPAAEEGNLRMELIPFVDENGVREIPGLAFDVDGRTYYMVPTDKAAGQISDRTLGIRKAYRKIAEDCPQYLPDVINHYLKKAGRRRLLRGYQMSDGKTLLLRGMLGETYRVLDHKDAAFTMLEGAKLATDEAGLIMPKVHKWSVSESKFELSLYCTDIWSDFNDEDGEVHVGELPHDISGSAAHRILRVDQQGGRDIVFAGARVRNSEVGQGMLEVSIYGNQWQCNNGVFMGKSFAQFHIGRTKGEEMILRPETIAQDNAIIFQKLRDAIVSAFNPEEFGKVVREIRDLKQVEIKQPAKAIAVLVERENLTEETKDALLAAYVGAGAKPTAFDLYTAVTNVHHNTSDEEVADKMEAVACSLAQKDRALLRALK